MHDTISRVTEIDSDKERLPRYTSGIPTDVGSSQHTFRSPSHRGNRGNKNVL